MPDLNLNCDYFDHRKTKRLVGLLGRGAEVIPIKLWSYCGKFHADTGRLAGYSEQEIESLAGWWGKPGEMLPSLVRAEFMHKDGDDWVMTGWLDHQGHIASFKRRGRENALKRWGNHASSITNSNAARNAPTVLTVPTTSLSSASESGPDPNTWQPKLVVKPKPQSGERIGPIHAWYSQQMGAEVRLDAMVERLWHDWFTAGYDEDQFKRVFKYLRGQIKNQKRNDGAVLLSNMLQPDRFGSDLALASVQRKPMQAAPAPEIATPAKPYDATKSAGLIAALKIAVKEGKA